MDDQQQVDQQDQVDTVDAVDADEGYPPDEDGIDAPGMHVPKPRSAAVRRHGRSLPRSKAKSGVTRGIDKQGSRILAQQKRRQSLELRKAGATYQQIAEAVGYYDAAAARKAVLKAYGDIIQEPVTELKTLQIERLNHMLMVLWPRVQTGDISAMNTSLSIMNKIDALMGTEAARQIEVKNDSAVLVVDGNKDDYITALKKMSGMGVQPDGSNAPDPNNPILPAVAQYPPGMGPAAITAKQEERNLTDVAVEEVIDAVLVDEEQQEQVAPAVETKKKFAWGMDPKVQPRPKGER